MILVFYKLNSAIESGTKPDALGSKPCHWTSTLKAAMVNARRASKYAQNRCMTLLKWQTKVSIESTVSTKHAVLPLAPLTQFQVAGIPLRGMESGITQDNHAFF